MAQSVEERRKDLAERIANAEARAKAYTAKAEGYRLKDKADKAAAAERTARRQAAIAGNHRLTLDRLEIGSRKAARLATEAAARKAGIEAQQDREAQERTARPVDRLQAYTEALQHAEELAVEAERYQRRADGYRRSGDHGQAEKAARIAEQRLGWRSEWLGAAEEQVEAGRQEGLDVRRAHRVALKAKERQAGQDRKEEARLADLKLEENLGTAAARREYVVGGKRKERVVKTAEYELLLRRPQDRTPIRLEAMERFDVLVSTADAGLFPEAKFEAESSSGKGAGALVLEKRAAGLEELADLEDAIGPSAVALLRARIYERQNLVAMVRSGMGSESAIGLMIVAAIDAMAVFWKTRSRLQARAAGMGVELAPRGATSRTPGLAPATPAAR